MDSMTSGLYWTANRCAFRFPSPCSASDRAAQLHNRISKIIHHSLGALVFFFVGRKRVQMHMSIADVPIADVRKSQIARQSFAINAPAFS